MPTYDLIREHWIPVTRLDGNYVELGLKELLIRSHEVRELAVDSPLERVAMLRLLLAILYDRERLPTRSAFEARWSDLWQSGRLPEAEVAAYFAWPDRADRFDLFHAERPFYQIGGFETDRADPISRLATELATGNNATLFDHRADDEPDPVTPAKAARMLIACQGYALGFGKASAARVNGLTIERPYSADAPLLRGITVALTGKSLFETLMLNLAPYEGGSGDRPAWGADDPLDSIDTVASSGRAAVSSRGLLDLLTWQSRMLRLVPETAPDGATVVRRVYFTQGRIADKGPIDPMKTYRKDDKEGFPPLALSAARAAWRDAHALFRVKAPAETVPLKTLAWVADRRAFGPIDDSHAGGLNVVGLATAPNKAGKFLLWRDDRMPLPLPVLDADANLLDQVRDALKHAESRAVEVHDSVLRLAKLYLAPEADRGGMKPDPKAVNALADTIDPRAAFWAALEEEFYTFLTGLSGDPIGAQSAWRERVDRLRWRALRAAQDALGHELRAMRAVARESGERMRRRVERRGDHTPEVRA